MRARLALVTLLALPLAGCESQPVIWLELAEFGQGAVDGVWMWRLSASGAYDRSCRIALGDPAVDERGEFVTYVQSCPSQQPLAPGRGRIERYAADPDRVRLRIRYSLQGRSGTYRVTAYGAHGETRLSDTTLELRPVSF
ncbi:MAG: hypothetical protein DCC71_05170 [Proteobacteria bacterium]|nr:MAG: hypothetical protein DCC71_05170 [Pseudomonadota bacterium]